MILEELIAKLGFKVGNLGEARRFIKALEDVKRASRDASRGLKLNFGPNNLGRLSRDFDRASASARRFRTEIERTGRTRGPTGGGRPGTGGGVGVGVGGVGAALAAGRFLPGLGVAAAGYGAYSAAKVATQNAITFERAMIEVGKATDTKGAEREAYAQQLMQLSRDTGQKKGDLAQLLSAAGFAGRPKGDLLAFTEYGAKASVAWQTEAQATGQALAEIGNIYQAHQGRIEEIGDAINTMADNSASRESDLLEFIRRAGASSKDAGMSAENILAFGAAMKEVGVGNEVAGTSFETLLNVMKLGEEFSKSADDGIKALGLTSNKMRKAFVANPVEAILNLFDRISKIKDPLKKAEVMTNLFGKEFQDDMSRLSNAMPKIKEYLTLMSKGQNYKGSVRMQFGDALDTDVGKIDRATAAWDSLITRVGNYVKALAGLAASPVHALFDRLEKGFNMNESVAPNVSDARLRELNGMGPQVSREEFDRRAEGGTSAVPLSRPSIMDAAGRKMIPPLIRQPRGRPVLGYSTEAPTAPILGNSFGLGTGAGDWMRQGTQQTVQNVTNNTNTGNDQRQQSASVTVNATGLAEVGALVKSQVQAGLAGLGPSIVKGQSAATGASTAP